MQPLAQCRDSKLTALKQYLPLGRQNRIHDHLREKRSAYIHFIRRLLPRFDNNVSPRYFAAKVVTQFIGLPAACLAWGRAEFDFHDVVGWT